MVILSIDIVSVMNITYSTNKASSELEDLILDDEYIDNLENLLQGVIKRMKMMRKNWKRCILIGKIEQI